MEKARPASRAFFTHLRACFAKGEHCKFYGIYHLAERQGEKGREIGGKK